MKQIFSLVLSVSLALTAFGQSEGATDPPASDSLAKRSTLTLGTSYSNNANYYGQKAAERMPYLLGFASWKHHSGFYFTGMGYRLLNDSSRVVSATAVGAGITFKTGDNVTADLSYSHTFYPSGSPFLQAANANSVSASLTFDNWLSTTANVDYAFGKTNDVFASLGTGKFITLGSLLSPSDFVSITPSAEIVGGTRHFYQSYVTEKRLRDSVAGLPLPPLLNETEDQTTSVTSKKSTSFDLLTYNFKLPLAYNRATYQIEVGYQLSVLSNKTAPSTGRTNSFFTASFYYQF
jgi:hypothetical protein